MWNRVPLVVILGPTGVGKTKLSLELAKRFTGEILSADSMQVYKGLDIITNKATDEERAIAPHHALDFLDPLKKFTVVHFRNLALPIIRDLQKSKKLPIVVGGTHYYIESLLWDVLLEDEDDSLRDSKCDVVTARADLDELNAWTEFARQFKNDRFPSLSTDIQATVEKMYLELEGSAESCIKMATESMLAESQDNCEELCLKLAGGVARIRADIRRLLQIVDKELKIRVEVEMKRMQLEINSKLHQRLRKLDPDMASALHPNSRRKVLRSLQILASKGMKQSEILSAQRGQEGGSDRGGPLRYKDAILFWIRCKEDILDKRLDDRVDDMLKKGLVQELLDFHKKYNENRLNDLDPATAYTQGIFQSIGFKEFHQYLTLDDEEKRNSDEGQKLLSQGIVDLKTATRQYARRQIRWINNRFIRVKNREVPDIYGLDATDLDVWDETVLKPAVEIVGARLGLSGYSPTIEPLPREEPVDTSLEENFCTTCNRVFTDSLQWKVHLKSNKHKRAEMKRQRESLSENSEQQKKMKTSDE